MSLERIRRATKEELEEIKVLKQGMLDYLELKGIDDSLVLSTLACLTAQAAIVIALQEKINIALEDDSPVIQIFYAMSDIMIRIVRKVEVSKKSFFSVMNDIWDEMEDEK